MKKVLLLLFTLAVCVSSWAQTMQVVPQGFNFQAQIRDANGKPKTNEVVELKIGLYQGQYASEADYTEIQSLSTNNFGLINTVVGNGQSNDLITDLDFSAAQYWIKVALKENDNYKVIHFAALWSVPYALVAGNVQAVPAGSVVAYFGNKDEVPSGWLLCDGKELDRGEYKSLFEAIKTSSGHGNGTTTFNIPDLRGMFLRGVDNETGNDPDVLDREAVAEGANTGDNVGTCQADTFAMHNHTVYVSAANYRGGGADKPVADPETGDSGNYLSTNPIKSAGGNETRPKNISVWWIIKH